MRLIVLNCYTMGVQRVGPGGTIYYLKPLWVLFTICFKLACIYTKINMLID